MLNMPESLAREYWLAIDMLEAQEMLLKLRVSDYPNNEQRDRRKLNDELMEKAYFKEKEKLMTTKQVFAFLQKELG